MAKKITATKLFQHAQFHGANKLVDKTSRWFWAPSLLILLGVSITLVMMTVKRYQDNPTYMVQINKSFGIRAFPTVVLCPEVNLVDVKMDQFVLGLNYPPGMNSEIMREILPQLAAFYSLDTPYNLLDLMRVEQVLDFNGIDVETAGRILTATCEETLIRCRFDRFMVNCSDLFQMEFTGDGFCCVFNGRSLKREMELYGTHIEKTKPHQKFTTNFGFTSGMMLAINQSQKLTSVDLSYKWIALMTSRHFVDTTMNGTALSPGYEQWIAYYSKGFQIDAEARALRPALRQCNLSTEKLRYFPIYSKKYCLLEKEIATTLRNCKCVRSTHPRPPGASRCRAGMLHCSTQTLIAFSGFDPDCPATCDVEKTTVVESSFALDDSVKTIEPFYNGLDFKKVSVVRAFIQSYKRPTLERRSYFTYLDLFSQLGGMFNVFFGCSVLTLLALVQVGWYIAVEQWKRLRIVRK